MAYEYSVEYEMNYTGNTDQPWQKRRQNVSYEQATEIARTWPHMTEYRNIKFMRREVGAWEEFTPEVQSGATLACVICKEPTDEDVNGVPMHHAHLKLEEGATQGKEAEGSE